MANCLNATHNNVHSVESTQILTEKKMLHKTNTDFE